MERAEAIQKLNDRFEAVMDGEVSKGMIDIKPFCRTPDDATPLGYLWTLTNALEHCNDDDVVVVRTSGVDAVLERHFH